MCTCMCVGMYMDRCAGRRRDMRISMCEKNNVGSALPQAEAERMCIDMCTDTCTRRCIEMRTGTCMDLSMDMCTCVDVCADTCIGDCV